METENFSNEEKQVLDLIAEGMVGYVMQEAERLQRLKETPEGFHLFDRAHPCCICNAIVKNEKSWYDNDGIKCITCHKSLQRGEISIDLKNHETWYSETELDIFFNLKRPQINRWIKEQILFPLHIMSDGNKVYRRLFPLKSNKEFLPPKTLLKGGFVKEILDGQELYSNYPWYNFVDPIEHLKAYGISKYLRFVPLPDN